MLSEATQILLLPMSTLLRNKEPCSLALRELAQRMSKYVKYLKKIHYGQNTALRLQDKANYLIRKHKHFSYPEVGSDVFCLEVTLQKENSWRKSGANIWQV